MFLSAVTNYLKAGTWLDNKNHYLRPCLAEVDELDQGQLAEALGFTQLMKEVGYGVGYRGMLCMRHRDIMTGRLELKSRDVMSRCVQELSP